MDGILEPAMKEMQRLTAYIKGRIAPSDDPEDVMQDVFLALVSRWNMGDGIRDAMAWMLGVAARKAADALRRRSRRALSLDAMDEGISAGDIMDLADHSVGSEEEAAEREELRAAIEAAIGDLPPEQREVFVMHEIEGRSFGEIQARTGAPLNTLLARKRYAVLKLRKSLSRCLGTGKEE